MPPARPPTPRAPRAPRCSGKVTKAKFGHYIDVKTVEKVRSQFKGADTDGDRQLTKFEFNAFVKKSGIPRKRGEALWDKVDANGNGKINFKEFKNFAEERMAPATIDELFRNDPDDADE